MAGLTQDRERDARIILRIIGDLYTLPSAINVSEHGRYGITIVTEDALASLAVPDLVGDFEASWMWNNSYNMRSSDRDVVRWPIDSKAKRLYGTNSQLVFVIDSDPGSAGTIDWHIYLRILYGHR